MKSTQRDWLGHVLAGLAGALTTLAFSPFDLWPVMLVSAALLFVLLNTESSKVQLLRGLLFGTGMYGTGVSWVYVSIHQFGSAPAPLAAVLTGLFVLALAAVFTAPMAWLYGRLSKRQERWKKVLLFSGVWVLAEWFRSWFLTGFPWLYTGYSLLDTPFSGLAPVTGVYGLSLLVSLSGASLAAIIQSPGNKALYGVIACVIATAVTAAGLKHTQWTEQVESRPLTFSAVQGNISQSLKWDPGHLDSTINTFLTLSANHWRKDLLFWPENAIPTLPQNIPGLFTTLAQQAENTETALLLGAPTYKDDSYYNTIIGMGRANGEYYKQKLVPFGEFVPLESMLRGLITFFNLPMSSFSRGESDQHGLTIDGNPLAAYICYEVVYPDFAARQAENTGFLLTVSNDTWFGSSIGPVQHFQMVRMRSLETGRWQLRATNDGITALINPKGEVVSTLPRYQQGVLEGELPAMTGSTPFMRFGSWPVLFLSVLLLLPCCSFRKR